MTKKKPALFSDHDVRVRAYLIWERNGKPEGQSENFWREALKELEAENCQSEGGGGTAFVPTHSGVSTTPLRSVATAISAPPQDQDDTA